FQAGCDIVRDGRPILDDQRISGSAAANATINLGNGGGDTTIEIVLDELATGDTLIIEYRATIPDDVAPGLELINTADLTYDSLPTDDDPNERDYSISDDAETLTRAPELTKTIIDTTFDETVGNDLAIGEEVTFEIRALIPEGTAPITITDTLPTTPGTLTFLSAVVTEIGTDIAGSSALPVGATASPVGGVISFDFGTIINMPDSDDLGEEIVIQVTARVEDLPANESGDILTNQAQIIFGPNADDTVNAEASVHIVEPDLSIAKSGPAGPVDAGDRLTYMLEIQNSGTGPAYDIQISDLLEDPALVLVAGSVSVSDGTAIVTAVGDGFQVNADALLSGGTLTITFEADVRDAVLFNSSVANTATIDQYDSNPSDDPADESRGIVFDPGNPDPNLTDDAEVATPSVTLEKSTSSLATDQDETGSGQFDGGVVDLSVGEEVTYTLEISVPEGSGDLVLTDTLPPGLQAIGAEVVAFGTDISSANLMAGDTDASGSITISGSGDSVAFDFGTVVSEGFSQGLNDAPGAGDLRTITVEVTAVVADVAAAAAGTQLTNTATLQVFDPDSGTELTDPTNPVTATETVEVVEPALVIDKTAPIAADQGDTVSYTVEIRHDASSTGPAHDVVMTDLLADGNLNFDGTGSVVVSGVTGAVVAASGTGFTVTIPTLDVGDVATITYTATLDAGAPPAESFPNTAEVIYDSDPGPGGRMGMAEDTARVSTVPVIDKSVASSSYDETVGSDLGLGEVVTYRLEVFLPEVLNEGVLVTDTLPAGLTPLAVRVIDVGTDLSAEGMTVTNLNAPLVTIAGQMVTIDFEDINNAADFDVDAGDRLVIEVDAVLDADAAENLDGEVLMNSVNLSLTAGGTALGDDDTAEVTVVVPELALTKTADATAPVDAGDVISFTLEIPNTGTGPAYDIALEDLMADAGLSLVTGSVVASDGTSATEVPNGDGTLGFTLDIPVIGAGETLTVTYQARVTDAAAFNGTVENTAQVVSYDTNPGEPGDAGFEGEIVITSDPTNPDDPLIDDATVEMAGVTLEKSTSSLATDQDETGSGQFDGGVVDLSVGEEVTYTLEISVPEGSGDLVLTDALPPGLQAIGAEVVAFGTDISSANLMAGDTDASGSITISGS
ncbi:MAG: isopeptide-forming domain-containing fimbrial protein, partial [Pseudomonadota bacterium]